MSFGGGGFTEEINVLIRDSGSGVMDSLAAEAQRLKDAIAAMVGEIGAGGPTTLEQTRQLAAYERQLAQMERTIARFSAAQQTQATDVSAAGAALAGYASTLAPLANSSKRAADATEALAQYAGQVTSRMTAAAAAARQQARDEAILERQTRALSDALQDMARHEADADAAFQSTVVTAPRAARGVAEFERSTKSARGGALAFAFALDDLEYGLRGVGNNLIQMATFIPGGWGAAITVGASVAIVMARNWGTVSEYLGIAQHAMGGTIERLKELEAQTSRNADQEREYNKLKEEGQRIDALAKLRSESQKGTEQAIQKVIGDLSDDRMSGLDKIIKGLVETRNPGGYGNRLSPREQETMKAIDTNEDLYNRFGLGAGRVLASGLSGREFFKKERRDLMDAARDREINRAKQDIEAATQDQDRLRGLINEVGRAPGAFPKGLADQLRATTPEAREQALFDQGEAEAAADEVNKGNAAWKQKRKGMVTTAAGSFRPVIDTMIDELIDGLTRTGDRGSMEAKAKEAIRARMEAADVNPLILQSAVGAWMEDFNKQLTGRLGVAGFGKPGVTMQEAAGAVAETTKAAKAEGRAETREERERQQEVERQARLHMPMAEGATGDMLDQAIARGVGQRLDGDQIAAQLIPQIARVLERSPTLPPDLRGEVAARLARQRIDAVAPRVAAAGPANFLQELGEKRFDAAANERRGDQRRMTGLQEQQVRATALGHARNAGFNPEQSNKLAAETLKMTRQGWNLLEAEALAVANLQNEVRAQGQKLDRIGQINNRQRPTLLRRR